MTTRPSALRKSPQPRRRPRATPRRSRPRLPTTETDGAATLPKSKTAKRKGKAKATKAAPVGSEFEAATGAPPTAKPVPRAGTKRALMIDMLKIKRPEGATVEQIAAATGWQHHTIRGGIPSGALKKKLGLTVEAIRTGEVGPNKTGARAARPSTGSSSRPDPASIARPSAAAASRPTAISS